MGTIESQRSDREAPLAALASTPHECGDVDLSLTHTKVICRLPGLCASLHAQRLVETVDGCEETLATMAGTLRPLPLACFRGTPEMTKARSRYLCSCGIRMEYQEEGTADATGSGGCG